MGNAPSESQGETCITCRRGLSPVTSFDRVKHVTNWYWGASYEYNYGEYYRQMGIDGGYQCSGCWWGAVTAEEGRRQQEENRRREEERRRQEEERRRREEEQRRQEKERRRQEEERRQKEEALIEKISKEIEAKLQSGESLSDKQLNWMREKSEEHTMKESVKKQTFESDSEILAMDKISNLGHQDVQPVTFGEDELQDPHFRENNYQISIENMFMKKPYLGKGLSLKTLVDVQSWLVQIVLENKLADRLERNLIEEIMCKIQNSLNADENFYLTQALIEIALFHGKSVLSSQMTAEKENFMQVLTAFLQTNAESLKKDSTGISFLVDMITSKVGLSSQNSWIRATVDQLFKRLLVSKGSEWNDFLEACQDVVIHSQWKPSAVVAFVFSLASQVTSTDDMNQGIILLHQVVSFNVPESSLDITGESIATAQQKVMAIVSDKDDRDVGEILKELEKDHNLGKEKLQTIEQITTQVLNRIQNNATSCGLSQLKLKIKLCFVDQKGEPAAELADILYELCVNVKKLFGWWPRATQIVSTSLLCIADMKLQPQLLEMATGEGKSCVIGMFATCLALQDENVDIITSSPVLAKRDANEWQGYYGLFGLTVGCNGGLTTADERLHCYKQNIVYGTIGDFAADVLRQEFEMDDIRGNRTFDNVVVDEVDQMTLDQGIQFTYLSHRMVGIRQLEPVLAIVWATVNQHIPVKNEDDEVLFAGQSVYLFDAIVQSIDPESCGVSNYSQLVALAERENLVTPSFGDHAQSDDPEKKREVWKEFDTAKMLQYIGVLSLELPVTVVPFLSTEEGCVKQAVPAQLIDQDQDLVFILVLEDGRARPLFEMDEIAIAAMGKIKENVSFGNEASQGQGLRLPKFLESYVDQRLPVLVRSAFTAMTMSENREYIVKDGSILPVDFSSTGVIEKNKKWGDGLQQFMEMKHFCRVSSLSLVTNFMSNVTYFKRYDRLFGASGTLGGDVESAFLKAEYNANVCTIPTHKKRKLYSEKMTVVEGSTDEWVTSIIRRLREVIQPKPWGYSGRAALVICEDIDKAQKLHAAVLSKISSSSKLYTEDNEAGRTVLADKLGPGGVLVATNLAGRGTNIKVTDDVNLNGGLYVLVTFIPRSKRIQLQAFGRTARKGAPGSAKIIVHEQSLLPCYHNEPHAILMSIRDHLEIERITLMQKNDLKEVELRQKLFGQYCSFLESMYSKVHGFKKEEITLDALNEHWGIWLQMQTEKIDNLAESDLMQDLRSLLTESEGKLLKDESPSQNIYHVVRFANEYMTHDGDNQPAIDLLNKAIVMDEEMASIAYYNRAKCIIMQAGPNYLQRAKDDLEKAEALLVNGIRSAITVLQILNHTKPNNAGQHFAEQCQKRQDIVDAWRANIEKAITKLGELISNDNNAIVTATAIYHILPNAGQEETMLLLEMADMGLERVFTVEKKVEFNIGALIVFLIGVVEIVAGAVLVATGIAVNFGMGLIVEGVADVIEGVKGMITGDFDIKQWAIEKAVSIAISVVTGGIGKAVVLAKKVGVAGMKAAMKSAFKGGIRGIKTAMKSGLKKGITLTKTTLKKPFQESFGNITNTAWRKAVKENLKKAGKHAAKEMAEQGAEALISESIDKMFEGIMEAIKQKLIIEMTTSFTKSLQNGKLRPRYDAILLNYIPKEHLGEKVFMTKLTKELGRISRANCQSAVTTLVSDNEVAQEIGNYTKEFLGELVEESNVKPKSGKTIQGLVEAGYDTVIIAKMTADLVKLSSQFEDVFCKNLDDFLTDQKIPHASISNPPATVAELKAGIASVIADEYITAMCDIAEGGLSITLVERAKQGMNKARENILGKRLLKKDESEDKLKEIGFNMRTQFMVAANKEDTADKTVQQYVENIQSSENSQEMVSLVAVKMASTLLNISVFIAMEDQNGDIQTVTSVHPESEGEESTKQVTLIFKDDDQLCVKSNTDQIIPAGSNDIFTAISKAQKPEGSREETENESRKLKEMVAVEVRENKDKWAVYISRTLKLEGFYAKRKEILQGESPTGAYTEEARVKVTAYIKQNLVNRISKGIVFDMSLGKAKLTPQAERPMGLDLTCRRYPSLETVKSLLSRDGDGSSKVMAYLQEVADDSRGIINFMSLTRHTEDGLRNKTVKQSLMTEQRICTRLQEDNVPSALKLSFISDFPDTVRCRISNSYKGVEKDKNQAIDKVMVLDSDTVRYYKDGFLGVVTHYYKEKLLSEEDWIQVKKWVLEEQYTKVSDEKYIELCDSFKM